MTKKKPASAKTPIKKSDQNVKSSRDDFESKVDLNGKNDSGPEPEVHGRDIPPQ